MNNYLGHQFHAQLTLEEHMDTATVIMAAVALVLLIWPT